MLDINFIKQNQDQVKKAIQAKRLRTDVGQLLKLDEERRRLVSEVDELRQQRHIAARERDIEKGKKIKKELTGLEGQLVKVVKDYQQLMLEVPNVAASGVPEGGEEDYQVLSTKGEPAKFDFGAKDHVEIGEMLDIIDITRAAKVSGGRFSYLKNEGVLLEFAIVNFALENLMKVGFTPIIPPVLIKSQITQELGYWHGGDDENYYLVTDYQQESQNSPKTENQLYLVGTAEHSIVPMHKGEVLDQVTLPKKYVAFSSCFRREAGSYGKDTRGILRVHQFDKVEMVEFVKPEDDEMERRKMLGLVEDMMRQLELPYRVIKLANGDLGFPVAETIDIETWIPSQNKFRETHSISTTTDFQARSLNIKYKDQQNQTQFVHILNGTAFAIGRTIVAILENFQQRDGSVVIPEVLRKYTHFSDIKPKYK